MATVKNDYSNEIVSGLPFVFGRTGVTLEPIEKVDRANGVIKWGEKNLYPQWLNSLFYGSAIHSGIVRSKVYYISSGGLNYEGDDLEAWARMFTNGTSDVNLDQLAEQMALDLELYNGVALRGRWSLDRSNCARLDLIPFETCRQLVETDQIAVSPDWSNRNTGFMLYEPLDPGQRDSLQFYLMYYEKPKQVVFDGKQKVETGAYPLAPYIGGIKSIQTDIEIVNYSHSEIINNFGLGTIINLNGGKPKTPQDRKKLEARIKGATGTDAAGGTVVLFNNGKDNAATIEKLNGNDLNDRYISLSADVRNNILLSHSVTSATLFGLSMDGNFNASEMEIGYEIMKANYFKSRQEALLSLIRTVATLCNNITGEISFNEISLASAEVKEPAPVMTVKIEKEKHESQADKSQQLDALIIEEFKKVGQPKEGLKFLASAEVDTNDIEQSKLDFIKSIKDGFALTLEKDINVIRLIANGESYESMLKALKLNPSDLSKIMSKLAKLGLLDSKGQITEAGLLEVAAQGAETMNVVYSYAKRPGVTGPDDLGPGRTRDFCRELISLNRVYTREEIDQIGVIAKAANLVPFEKIWIHSGGWWNRDGVNVPKCRHGWEQKIVLL